MNMFSSLSALATVAALALLPISIELSISFVVVTGLVALLAKDYGSSVAPIAVRS